MTVQDFSFAAYARNSNRHIRASIPGYDDLYRMCVWLSRDFVQNETTIIDIGCTTGKLLRAVRNWNQVSRPAARYLGLDKNQCWQKVWRKRRANNVRFEVCDARSFDGFNDLSLAYDLFTLQFIPPRDRPGLLRRVHDGLIEGGALIIAAKVLANSAWSQEALTAHYHERKRQRGFSNKHILDKQLNLRGQMVLWTEARLVDALREAGFQEIQRFWQSYLFVAMVARKGDRVRSETAPNG
jgi:tRNA (cmo5U34)-methyltransferase